MKEISDIRIEEWGYFLDQSNGGKIGINLKGEILLDEGEGDNCFHNAIVAPSDFRGFRFHVIRKLD